MICVIGIANYVVLEKAPNSSTPFPHIAPPPSPQIAPPPSPTRPFPLQRTRVVPGGVQSNVARRKLPLLYVQRSTRSRDVLQSDTYQRFLLQFKFVSSGPPNISFLAVLSRVHELCTRQLRGRGISRSKVYGEV